MASEFQPNHDALERLSALVDGETDAARCCSEWRESVEMRASWHAYHLIGDVLRSDDLACTASADMAFLAGFRQRMTTEAVVLAPQPASEMQLASVLTARTVNSRWPQAWRMPSAMAAGLVAVVGVTLLVRSPAGAPEATTPVALSAPLPVSNPQSTADIGDAAPTVASGQLIRDARLDRYLAAHKQFAGSSALGIPSGFLRNATATESER